jgi:S-adenosylmethionine hydrolase
VAVVDPGVGTRRRALCIETKHGLYLGPDNGVLALAVRNHETKLVYAIANREFVLPKVSDTFHGRDLFSPAAAHLARGRSPSDVGPELRKMLIPKFAEVVRKKKRLFGEVIHVDDFGNVVTNIREKEVRWMRPGRLLKLRIKNTRIIAPFCKTYGQVEVQKPLGLIGSHGFLEVSINQGHAAEKFRVKTGDNVTLYRS